MNVDIQLMSQAVMIQVESIDGGTIYGSMTHSTFDAMMEQCVEASLNKKGRTGFTVEAQGLQEGDVISGMEIETVYTYKSGGHSFTQLIFKPGGVMQVVSAFVMKAERPIE